MKSSQLRSRAHLAAQFSGRLILASIQILTIIVAAWHLLRIYPGDRWLPVRMGNYFAPWLFMALIPGLLMAWVGRRRRLLGMVAALIVLFVGQYWSILIPRQPLAYATPNTGQLRVMTFNVNFQNRNAQAIAGLVQAESPDLIAFQEMTADLIRLLRPKLEATHPYYLVDDSWGLPMVLMSRYPLTAQPKPFGTTRAQHAIVETPDGAIVIWNVHPNPVVDKGWEAQKKLLAVVANSVAAEDGPVIVLGDFNTTDQTENYRLIADHLTDVHRAVGQGFDFSFPDFSRAITPDQPWHTRLLLEFGPVIKIDHIFVSEHFIPQESYVVSSAYGSDHRPVMAELVMRIK